MPYTKSEQEVCGDSCEWEYNSHYDLFDNLRYWEQRFWREAMTHKEQSTMTNDLGQKVFHGVTATHFRRFSRMLRAAWLKMANEETEIQFGRVSEERKRKREIALFESRAERLSQSPSPAPANLPTREECENVIPALTPPFDARDIRYGMSWMYQRITGQPFPEGE